MIRRVYCTAMLATMNALLVVTLLSQEEGPTYTFIVGSDTVIVRAYEVHRKSSTGDRIVAKFTSPTLSMLLRYRPYVRENYGFDTTRSALIDIVNDVASGISAACVSDGRVWVGFGFYEGEFYDGIGGVGFYDLRTGRSGVLRHPALIDYSIDSIKVSKDTIYAVTSGHFEGSRSVGNGVVAISRMTLLAQARVPPGSETIWDKDGYEKNPAAPMYNRPIDRLITDRRFVPKKVRDWSDQDRKSIKLMGADGFMVKALVDEINMRQLAVSRAPLVFDESIRASTSEHKWGEIVGKSGLIFDAPYLDPKSPGCGSGLILCLRITFRIIVPGIDGSVGFGEIDIKPAHPSSWLLELGHNWSSARPGQSWTFEGWRDQLRVDLDSLVTRETTCTASHPPSVIGYFETAAIHVKYLRLQE